MLRSDPTEPCGLAHPVQFWRTRGSPRQAGGHWFEPSTAHHRNPL